MNVLRCHVHERTHKHCGIQLLILMVTRIFLIISEVGGNVFKWAKKIETPHYLECDITVVYLKARSMSTSEVNKVAGPCVHMRCPELTVCARQTMTIWPAGRVLRQITRVLVADLARPEYPDLAVLAESRQLGGLRR